jgi:YidC/Oxa1 family membrane protein insertase
VIHLATLLASSTTSTTAAASHKAGTSLLDPIAKPIAWVLAIIYSVIPNYGVSIIALSIIWMAIISPLTLKSTRSMLAMQKLQPQLKKLQEQHKNDKQAFAQAQMDLFREHQVSPFGSCLPMLLPLPVFFALFRVLEGLGRSTPKYLSPNTQMYKDIVASHGNLYAFGMNLSKNAFSPHSSVWAALPYWILVLVMGITGYLQSAQMMSRNPNAAQNPQMRLMKYLPLAFTVIFIRFPAGVLLYYATSNICRIVQQDLMYRFDPKVKALVAQEVEEVEELTQEIDQQQASQRGGGRRDTSKPPQNSPPSSGGSTSGRSRFRDMLAQAAEQQKKPPPSKPSATGPPAGKGTQETSPSNGSGTDRTPSSGAPSNAQAANGQGGTGGRTGASPNGQRRARKSTPGGHRTNRKRRGK